MISGVWLLIWFSMQLRSQTDNNSNKEPSDDSTAITETSFVAAPFYELTIPYLQQRTYHSAVGQLNQVSETEEYVSYITSYDSDGLKINALLTVPKLPMPVEGYPAVVFVHGYIPPYRYRTLDNYASYVDYLARQGLVVFKIDLRGHGDSEGDASGAYYSGDYVVDTLHARAAIQNLSFVDSEAVGLWGHSMAGNIVLRAMVAQPTISKSVIWAGAVYSYQDFQELGINDASYQSPATQSQRARQRDLLFATHGAFSAESEYWQMVPATNYLEGVTGAVQIHHALDDSVVSIEYSRRLVTLLDESDISHQLFEYKTGGHNLTGASFSQAMSRTAAFLTDKPSSVFGNNSSESGNSATNINAP